MVAVSYTYLIFVTGAGGINSLTGVSSEVGIYPSIPVKGKGRKGCVSKHVDGTHGNQAFSEKVQDLCIQCIAHDFNEFHYQSQN